MEYWQILGIVGVVFVIIEILTPVLFFLNLALACFLTAIVAFFVIDWNILLPIFVVASAIFLFFLRPLLLKSRGNGDKKTGVEEKYIGKTAKVLETVSPSGGVVSIYDERWNAKGISPDEIEAGTQVRIVKNEGLILYVEKLN